MHSVSFASFLSPVSIGKHNRAQGKVPTSSCVTMATHRTNLRGLTEKASIPSRGKSFGSVVVETRELLRVKSWKLRRKLNFSFNFFVCELNYSIKSCCCRLTSSLCVQPTESEVHVNEIRTQNDHQRSQEQSESWIVTGRTEKNAMGERTRWMCHLNFSSLFARRDFDIFFIMFHILYSLAISTIFPYASVVYSLCERESFASHVNYEFLGSQALYDV